MLLLNAVLDQFLCHCRLDKDALLGDDAGIIGMEVIMLKMLEIFNWSENEIVFYNLLVINSSQYVVAGVKGWPVWLNYPLAVVVSRGQFVLLELEATC